EEDLKKAMEDLARSNKDLEEFAYAISHDLQAPLRSMSGFAKILIENYRGRLDEEADKYLDFIISAAKRMQRMIEDILAYSRVGTRAGEFSDVDLEPVLRQATENLYASIEENGAVVTHGSLPVVKADQSQMILLLQNLIGNALKFTAGPPRVHVSSVKQGSEWVFSVQDNGIGIDPEQFDRLFVLFQRLHTEEEYPGTGVGLAICKKIVDRHGGRMWVESGPGQGSQFFFTIPVKD
ncbi:MAG: ATP-binding protein, partial [Thermodesulfovibrionales bacterium]